MGLFLDWGHPPDQFGPVDLTSFEGMPPMEGFVARQLQHGTLGRCFAAAFQHGLEMPSKVRMVDVFVDEGLRTPMPGERLVLHDQATGQKRELIAGTFGMAGLGSHRCLHVRPHRCCDVPGRRVQVSWHGHSYDPVDWGLLVEGRTSALAPG